MMLQLFGVLITVPHLMSLPGQQRCPKDTLNRAASREVAEDDPALQVKSHSLTVNYQNHLCCRFLMVL